MAAPSNTISNRQLVRQSGLTAAVAAATAAWFIPGGQPLAAFLTTFALTYGVTVASTRLAARGWKQEVVERRELIRSGTAPRRVIFGGVRTSGVLAFAQVTGSEKEYLHLVVVLAGHEVHSIGDVWFDDVRLGDLDGSGNVTTGAYAGLVRIKKYLGTASQTADADLIAENPGKWSSTDRLRGRAYIYVRMKWDQDRLPQIPQITTYVRGEKVYDTRDGVTRFSENPALLLRHYLLASYGLSCDSSRVDASATTAAANVCDQWVSIGSTTLSMVPDHTTDTWSVSGTNDAKISTGDRLVLTGTPVPTGLTSGATYYAIRRDVNLYQLATSYQNAIEGVAATFSSNGSGTQTWGSIEQRRYTANGSFLLDQTPPQIEDALRACMAGSTVIAGGLWRIFAGAYVAPSATITASSLRDGLVAKPRKARKDLTNEVSGTYTDPGHGWVSTQFPAVTDATYVTQDGGKNFRASVDMAWVTNAFRAQRLAKILLRRSRAAQVILPCKISALAAATAETVSVTLPQLGYTSKTMRVVNAKLTLDEGGLGFDLVLEEDDANVYDWAATEGIPPLQWSTPELVDRVTVAPPTGLTLTSLDSDAVTGSDGTRIARINVSWSAAADPNASAYELQWKTTAAAGYAETITVPANITQTFVGPVRDGVDYTVRVRTVRYTGQRSAWVSNTETVAPKSGAVTAPTSLSVTAAPGGYDLVWSASPDGDYRDSTILEATSNNRALATELVTVAGTRFSRTGLAGSVSRWYWVRHNDRTGNESTYFPSSATAGVTAVTLALGGGGVRTVADATTITAAPGSNPPGGDDYWAVYSEHDDKIYRWTPAAGAYSRAADGGDLIAGSVAADKIAVAQLSAISADLGEVTAGSIDIGGGQFAVDEDGNVQIRSAATGQRTEISNTGVKVYNADGDLVVELGLLS